MSVAPLGRDRLFELFQRSCRVRLTNETDDAHPATIVAAVFVLHQEDTSNQMLSFFGLNIGPEEGGTFDNDRLSGSPVVLVEALLRLIVDKEGRMIDAYAAATEEPQRALRAVTFGIKAVDGVLGPEDHVISIAPRFAVFGRPAS